MFKKIFLLGSIIFLLVSCNSSESYLLTYQAKFRIIERIDHQKCVSQGLDYGEWNEIITEMYWRCRYNLVMDRKMNDAITADAIKNNAIVKKIGEGILKKLSKAKYSALAAIEEDIELSDHNQCIKLGYNLGINELNDEYYLCRQDLILSRIPPAPRVTNIFETSILSKKRGEEYLLIANNSQDIDKEGELTAKMIQKYPECSGLNIHSDDFIRCSAATDESNRCLSNINSLKIKKELEDKIYCQQQAFIQFPDNYALAKDKSSSEIEKIILENKKRDSETLENNSALLYLEGKRTIKSNEMYLENSNNKENYLKDGMYNRIELLKLREQFIYQCNKTMENKLPYFAEISSKNCLKIAKEWDN